MPRRFTPLCALLLAGAASAPAGADPGYYVVTPYDNEGLRIADFRYWTVQKRRGMETIWPELGLGYGVTSRWTTELFMSWIGSSRSGTRPDSLNWQNDVLLTQGEWPLDIALHTQLIVEQQAPRPRAFEVGPVLQTDFGRLRLNTNVFFEHASGTGETEPTELKYQWSAVYRVGPVLGLGAQGFGELGTWNHWAPSAQQSHRAGPYVSGNWPLGEKAVFKLQGAYLFGKTYGRDGHMFSLRAHLDF